MQLTLFDYQQLDTETRIIVQQRTSEIKALMKRTAQDIIEIGEKLSEVRDRLSHNKQGGFESWVNSEFGWSRMTAYKYINIWDTFGNCKDTLQLNAGIEALALLASPSTPEPARLEAIARAQNGETITHAAAREIVSEHKPTNGNGHTFENTAPAIPFDTRPLFADDPELDAALDDESRPVCRECGQVYDGANCPDCQSVAFTSMPHVAFNSGDNEWYTPQEYIESARAVMGQIDLDPASSEIANGIVKATKFYSADDDGLAFEWGGKVWMNPPYARELIGPFCEKLGCHFQAGDIQEAIVLINNATETKWFQRLAGVASALCLPEGRVQFWHPEKVATPLQGQAILYIGDNPFGFIVEFERFGTVWRQGY